MSDSIHLGLPYLEAAQAQKHVTLNEALRRLDALVQLSVIDTTHDSPPTSPVEGARYIVATPASGTWSGKENRIAAFADGAWTYFTPARAGVPSMKPQVRDWFLPAPPGAARMEPH